MELRIEIEPGTDPIRGRVHGAPSAPSQSFVGWMGLVELIAAAADLDESAPEAEPPR